MNALFATSNPGKVREVAAILEGTGLSVEHRPMWLGWEENGVSYAENALRKAEALMRMSGLAVLAEDSGIEVDALDGRPGLHSARFAGPGATDAENNEKLLRLLRDVPDEGRGARYRAVAVLLLPTGEHLTGEGTFEGRIGREPRGAGGFGYDPLFQPEGDERTAAELTPSEKNERSHRAGALRSLVAEAERRGLL